MTTQAILGLKKGDKVLLKHSNNGMMMYDGQIVTVLFQNHPGNYVVLPKTGNQFNIFSVGNPNDDFVIADVKERIKYYKENLANLAKEKKEIEEEIEKLEKYPTEEDWVAHKLNLIFEAKDKGEKAIAEVLKTLKASNYL
jgi:hypothetical protein